MNNDLNHIDEIVKNSLGDYKAGDAKDGWDDFEKKLDSQKNPFLKFNLSSFNIYYLSSIIAIAVVVGLSYTSVDEVENVKSEVEIEEVIALPNTIETAVVEVKDDAVSEPSTETVKSEIVVSEKPYITKTIEVSTKADDGAALREVVAAPEVKTIEKVIVVRDTNQVRKQVVVKETVTVIQKRNSKKKNK